MSRASRRRGAAYTSQGSSAYLRTALGDSDGLLQEEAGSESPARKAVSAPASQAGSESPVRRARAASETSKRRTRTTVAAAAAKAALDIKDRIDQVQAELAQTSSPVRQLELRKELGACRRARVLSNQVMNDQARADYLETAQQERKQRMLTRSKIRSNIMPVVTVSDDDTNVHEEQASEPSASEGRPTLPHFRPSQRGTSCKKAGRFASAAAAAVKEAKDKQQGGERAPPRRVSLYDAIKQAQAGNDDGNTETQFEGEPDAGLLALSAMRGETTTVKDLLRARAELTDSLRGRSALELAAERGHVAVVKLLFAANADLAELATSLRGKLLLAVAPFDEPFLVESLLAVKTDPEVESAYAGEKALYLAAASGRVKNVRALLDAGADVTVTHRRTSQTAMHAAAESGHSTVVTELLLARADVAARDSSGTSALQYAVERNLATVEALLEGGSGFEQGLRAQIVAMRAAAAPAHFAMYTRAAAKRARAARKIEGDLATVIHKRSNIRKYGFNGRGLTFVQLEFLTDQLQRRHVACCSPLHFQEISTKQVVESHLKPLTGKEDCGCPGCAWYRPVDPDDPAPDCPGPHGPHCACAGGSDLSRPCKFYNCCKKYPAGSMIDGRNVEGVCRGCNGVGMSGVDWCRGGPIPAMYFASHSWNQSFYEDIMSFRHFVIDSCPDHRAVRADPCPQCEGVSFWVCALAVNQHVPLHQQIIGSEGERATERCMKASEGIVLVLDDKLQPFGRVWCLYEVFLAVRDDLPLDIVTIAGTPTRGRGYDGQLLRKVREGIQLISLEAAKSFDAADRDHILGMVENEILGGIPQMECSVRDRLLGCFKVAEASADALVAVRSGNAELLEAAIALHPPVVQSADPEGDVPLMEMALAKGNPPVIELLVRHGAMSRGSSGLDSFKWRERLEGSAQAGNLQLFRALAMAYSAVILPSLTLLKCGLTSRYLATLAEVLQTCKMQFLNFDQNQGLLEFRAGGDALAKVVNLTSGLQTLSVANTSFSGEGLGSFVSGLDKESLCDLETFFVQDNIHLLENERGAEALQRLVRMAPKLRKTIASRTGCQTTIRSALERASTSGMEVIIDSSAANRERDAAYRVFNISGATLRDAVAVAVAPSTPVSPSKRGRRPTTPKGAATRLDGLVPSALPPPSPTPSVFEVVSKFARDYS
eukprot:TRINITY_DN28410_c0_g1_i1.p1 TRINITY_DN28410_c0_g1~~TRINITY_DN28410_c0_g1_i1.p1  ORF type:complete len:1191 (-),score=198.74 TRINITY_DN28410_c0_g1_i1:5-3514(-)